MTSDSRSHEEKPKLHAALFNILPPLVLGPRHPSTKKHTETTARCFSHQTKVLPFFLSAIDAEQQITIFVHPIFYQGFQHYRRTRDPENFWVFSLSYFSHFCSSSSLFVVVVVVFPRRMPNNFCTFSCYSKCLNS